MTQLETKTVLVVEDDVLIAMSAVEMLQKLGVRVIGPAYRLREGISLAQEKDFDAAILDVNLKGERSASLRDICRERKIPVILATGYDANDISLAEDEILVSKPYSEARLAKALESVFKD